MNALWPFRGSFWTPRPNGFCVAALGRPGGQDEAQDGQDEAHETQEEVEEELPPGTDSSCIGDIYIYIYAYIYVQASLVSKEAQDGQEEAQDGQEKAQESQDEAPR